jgi:3-oxoacyl-[acyl-carrier-protein] synthase-3
MNWPRRSIRRTNGLPSARGIKFRHIAGPDETTATLGAEAARNALDAAGMGEADIDLIIVATCTPDQTFPAAATKVQHILGHHGGVAFDVAAVCSGFLYGFSVAESMIRAGSAKNALVIGAETMTRLLDWEDRGTCVLFGDGAGGGCAVGRSRRARRTRNPIACRWAAQ